MQKINILYDEAIVKDSDAIIAIDKSNQFNVDVFSDIWIPTNFSKEYCSADYHLNIAHLITKYFPEIEINYLALDDLSNNRHNYIYPINFKFFYSYIKKFGMNGLMNQLDDRITEHLEDGILLLNDSHEFASYIPILHKMSTSNKWRKHLTFISSSNLDNQQYQGTNKDATHKIGNKLLKIYKQWMQPNSLNIYGFRFFEEVVAVQCEKFYPEYSYKNKLAALQNSNCKPILCLNNVVKQHRTVISFFLYDNNLLDKCYLSHKAIGEDYVNDLLHVNKWKINKKKLTYFVNELPIKADILNENVERNPWNIIPWELVNNSFIWLVTETLFSGTGFSRCYFTEKTYKPISLFMPFIMVGQPYALYNLRKEGYQTFSKWWDESYDEIVNERKRMQNILALIKKLCSLSQNEIVNMYQDMQPVLLHNHNKLLNSTAAKGFVTDLVNKYFSE